MDVPFESFAHLVYRLGNPPKSKSSQKPLAPTKIFRSWLNHLPQPLTPGTGKQLFRLLFPHEGSRRRYGLKEYKLALELEKVLGVTGLRKWDAVGWGDEGTGCLGKEVERAMRYRIPRDSSFPITIASVDRLLDQLAAHSPYSQLSQLPSSSLRQDQILTMLFRDSGLKPHALGLLTQIILRDLRPLLSPLPSLRVRNPTAMLRLKSNAGPDLLDLIPAMRCWDSRMAEMYISGQGNIDWCADQLDRLGSDQYFPSDGPIVGINVQIPKCRKGRSVEDALKEFGGSRDAPAPKAVWAETKYDGYRVQIHVHIDEDGRPIIRIFSKSKRDSTADRLNVHSIILAALGHPVLLELPAHPLLSKRVSAGFAARLPPCRSVILEAEVVPYNEGQRDGGRGPGIEEFWWLGSAGVTFEWADQRSAMKDHNRHLCLYFFDILHLNGENLLNKRLDERRQLLEKTVQIITGFSHHANYTVLDMTSGRRLAHEALQIAFDRSVADREEGLVLKAPESTYLDPRWRWVKLKKDYIPNLGDCIDLVLLGAGWDMDRARDLQVDTSVFTTFYIGVLTNQARVKAKIETPHFEILFRVSYGPDRDVLEVINQNIRHGRWRSKPYDKDDPYKRRLLGLSWTYKIPREMSAPSVLFEQPLCAEVMGAGFQKLLGSELYELRWPRLQKIYETNERSWAEALTSSELLHTAHQSLGYVTTPIGQTVSPRGSPQDDSVSRLWRSSSAVALTDIPDFPTPSPERPSPRRMQSAPDVLNGLKSSPPTPISSGRVLRRLFDDTQGETETGLWMVSPSSKRRRVEQRVDSTPSPLGTRRFRYALGEQERNGSDAPGSLPPSSPLFERTGRVIIPETCPEGSLTSSLVIVRSIGRRKTAEGRCKPLSLRSRLRMALLDARKVGVRA